MVHVGLLVLGAFRSVFLRGCRLNSDLNDTKNPECTCLGQHKQGKRRDHIKFLNKFLKDHSGFCVKTNRYRSKSGREGNS